MTTSPVTPEVLLQQLSWRYATKKFDATKEIPQATWEALEQSLIGAPSSFGLQPWHFVIVKDPAIRKSLQAHSWNQSQVVDASHLVVFAARTEVGATEVGDFLSSVAETRGIALTNLEGYRGMILQFLSALPAGSGTAEWSSRQLYIALGMLLSSAAMLGVDACPLEGIDSQKYNEILGLSEQGFSVKVACALGYRAADDSAAGMKKVRFSKERIISSR
jgi:nitroreductase